MWEFSNTHSDFHTKKTGFLKFFQSIKANVKAFLIQDLF